MGRTAQETQGLYWFGPPLWCNTLLQCVVWWISSGANDEQYKSERPRERCSCAWWCVDELGSDPGSSSTMVASPIYRGPGTLLKY